MADIDNAIFARRLPRCRFSAGILYMVAAYDNTRTCIKRSQKLLLPITDIDCRGNIYFIYKYIYHG